jgi:hypothetical protein
VREPTADVSATEAVIEALTGASVESDDKRLGLDDPLVTSVQTPAQQRATAEASQVSDEPSSPTHDDDPVSEDRETGSEGDDQQATEAAMDTLRKRRIERLRSGST